MPSIAHPRLLIVDDEAAQMGALCKTLEPEGYITTGFTSASQALETLRLHSFDLLLTDLMMPEMDGIALLRAATEIDPSLVGIVMTGHGTVGTAVDALKAGALDYILKPFKLSAIMPVLARALAVRRLRMENIQLRETVGIYELSMAVACGLAFETVLQKVADAAFQQRQARDVSILLPEPGGKELRVAVARGENAENVKGKRVPVSEALSGWVARTHELLARPDEAIEVHSAFASPSREIGGGISIPMLTGGKLVGILNFTSAQPQRPTTLGQIKALNILASAGGSALEVSSLLEQLRAAEQRYRRLAEDAPDIVFRYELHPRRCFAYINPAVIALTGYSPEEHYADPDLGFKIVHPDDRPLLEAILGGGHPSGSPVTMRWVNKNGAVSWVEQHNVLVRDRSGLLIAIEGIARDVTERMKLEEQLRHSQKMEAVGRLTAGVAHDFNNLLMVINGYSDLALREMPAGSPYRTNIEEVKKAGDQAAALTRQLLAFGRKQLTQPRALDLNALVKTNLNILRRLIGEDIELAIALDPELGSVKADSGQIEQVILNLAINSRDAMPQGGKLTIETHNLTGVELDTPAHVDYSNGRHVILSIGDTGCGMDDATQSRVFEPFFTTKELGRGTGLGLSIVYGIVKQSGGEIWVNSAPGRGTTFKICLPLLEESKTIPTGLVEPGAMPGGLETILVVEDDSSVRQLVCTILREAGYQILQARHAHEALQICQRFDACIGLVLTDLVMPQMSGPELVKKLRHMNAGVKILYTSGYADDTIARYGRLDPGTPFIQKPFSAASLLRKVRGVLDTPVADAIAAAGD